MAQLDRLLAAVVSHRADALRLATDDAAQLLIAGVLRPLTRQVLTSPQLLGLVREIAPADALRDLDAGRPTRFPYAIPEGRFLAEVTEDDGRWTASLARDAAMEEQRSPSAPASSSRAPLAPADANGRTPQVNGGVQVSSIRGEDHARDSMNRLLRQLVERGGSDLHLRCGEPPIIRKDGELVRFEEPALDDETMSMMLRVIMPERNREEFAASNDTDFAYEIEGVARFRANAMKERKGAAGVFRVIPATIVTAEQLGIPACVQQLCKLNKGLVLVTGPTGSGKSTTLCAMIDLVNRTRSDHIITIEDPIEFVHQNKRCVITQRQVGVHTGSFKSALRAALREDPDIILVGELRDLETVSIAIETAETGHLVFGTLHTTTAPSTVDRLIDQFPADRQEQIRVMLSESLRGVISQTLCRKVGGGRVAAQEILLSIPAVSNLIREGKTFQLHSIMQTSRRLGMVTLNDALLELVDAGTVQAAEAHAKASDKTGLLTGLRTRGHDVSFAEPEGSSPGAPPAAPSGAAKGTPVRLAASR